MVAMAAILDFRSEWFQLFWSTRPRFLLPNFVTVGLSVQEKKRKIDFQDGGHGGHLGFPIETILATFDLQITLILPTKFRVNWSFDFWEEAEIDFQDGGQLGFPIRTNLAIFDLQVAPILSTKFRINWPFGLEEAQNRFSRGYSLITINIICHSPSTMTGGQILR